MFNLGKDKERAIVWDTQTHSTADKSVPKEAHWRPACSEFVVYHVRSATGFSQINEGSCYRDGPTILGGKRAEQSTKPIIDRSGIQGLSTIFVAFHVGTAESLALITLQNTLENTRCAIKENTSS